MEVKTDIPKNLDKTELLKTFCKTKNISIDLVLKEMVE